MGHKYYLFLIIFFALISPARDAQNVEFDLKKYSSSIAHVEGHVFLKTSSIGEDSGSSKPLPLSSIVSFLKDKKPKKDLKFSLIKSSSEFSLLSYLISQLPQSQGPPA